MCGIAGILSKDTSKVTQQQLRKMTDVISHRGPDGEGQWISASGEAGLGHRRLSIIDLSHEADQPMHYLGRYTIVFNGEIYNYIELKETLLQQGYTFKTASDTEVLMALYHRDRENCLQLLDGMFAFVLYDAEENTAFIARDRFGEKPFYYSYEKGNHFYFGSEMKCLWAGGIPKEVNNRMLFNYLAYGFLDNPHDLTETFYNRCTRLPHSHYLKVNLQDMSLSQHPYYDIDWRNTDHSITPEQAREKFNELFYTSVKRRLRSDVPVGSSLSGGLDSSLVVTVIDELKKGTAQKQNTFSAVFPGFKKDERKFMDYVIAKTNVDPHFITPTDEGLMAEIDQVAWHQEEPFGSASIYVQYCVMKLAKEHGVTVLLDGQGADEILAGYHPYYSIYFNELQKAGKTDLYHKELKDYREHHAGSIINESVINGWKNRVKRFLPENRALLRKMLERYNHIRNPFFNSEFFNEYFPESYAPKYNWEGLNHTLYSSSMHKGLQELLRYADRNSMAHSREVRLPFLNHDLVEFLFTLPSDFKIRDGWTKWIMRTSFDHILPPEITWRKDKIGYEPPQRDWMSNPAVQNKIETSRDLLINSNIIHKKRKHSAQVAEDSNISTGNTWKMWMAGNLMK